MIFVLALSVLVILYHFVLFPLLLGALSAWRARPNPPAFPDEAPFVSIIVAVHNGRDQIEPKIANCMQLAYPPERYEVLIASDGSTDGTAEHAARHAGERVRVFDYPEHRGKIAALNATVPHARGKILVFTDISAMLDRAALRRLVHWFGDPEVGGVAGRKETVREDNHLAHAQHHYMGYEDFIRECEARIGSVASNEGFLYAMRRDLFQPLPEAVTDDLYNAMNVVRQGARFLYDPEAWAAIPPRSRSPRHELARRRRIVASSLYGIWRMRALLNPFRHGMYAVALFSHKVLRRLVPVFLLSALVAHVFLAFNSHFWAWLLLPHVLFYGFGIACHFGLAAALCRMGRVGRKMTLVYYFCLGNWGTLLGLCDFLAGRRVTRWKPTDASPR